MRLLATAFQVVAGMALSVAILGFIHGGRDLWIAIGLSVAALLLWLRGNEVAAQAATRETEALIRSGVTDMPEIETRLRTVLAEREAHRRRRWWHLGA